MNDYIKEIFVRMNLQQIRGFLLSGAEGTFPDHVHPYSDTLKTANEPIYNRLESLYPDGDELDNALADLADALAVTECVYMELGMKAGARLIYQLLMTDD